MPRVDSAEFQKWLEVESGIVQHRDDPMPGCEDCGVSESVYPFMRGYCVVCLAFMYGQFVKCQEIAMWAELNLPFASRGDINDRAAALTLLGCQYRVPNAGETDEEFAGHFSGFAKHWTALNKGRE